MADPKVLKYAGPGYFDGVPARDLRASDIAELGPDRSGNLWTAERLAESGHYHKVGGQDDVIHAAEAQRDAQAAEEPPKSRKG